MSVWTALWAPWTKVLVLPSYCRLPKVHPWLLGGHTLPRATISQTRALKLASALEDLGRKVELGLTLTKGKGWADQAATLIMQSLMYLRSKQKNCHTGDRYPQWLNNMLGKLSKEGSMYNSPEQGALALPLASTPQVPDSSAN